MSHRWLAMAAASFFAAAAPASAAPPPPEVHLPNFRIAEPDAGTGALVINVALDRPNPYPFPISVGVGDYTHIVVRGTTRTYGTATAGADYKPLAPFRLEWAPGQQIATFAVGLLGDQLDEADENINLRITAPSGVQIGDNDIDIVLADNDPNSLLAPLVQFPNAQLSEPDTGCPPYLVSLHLTRPAPAGGSMIVRDFTATHGTATPGVDYITFPQFTLAFAPGATTARFPVRICGDPDPEYDEEIDIRASGPVGVQLVDNDLDLVLRNDD